MISQTFEKMSKHFDAIDKSFKDQTKCFDGSDKCFKDHDERLEDLRQEIKNNNINQRLGGLQLQTQQPRLALKVGVVEDK